MDMTFSNENLNRLKAFAEPLVDNLDTTLTKVFARLDYLEKLLEEQQAASLGSGAQPRIFNPSAPPNLTHTKVLGVLLNGQPLGHGQENWNGLLNAAVRLAKARAKTDDELNDLIIVNYVKGEKTDHGYRFFKDLGISVQGQDANGAWRGAAHIALRLGVALSVTFAWYEKDAAAFPGVTGQFVIAAR